MTHTTNGEKGNNCKRQNCKFCVLWALYKYVAIFPTAWPNINEHCIPYSSYFNSNLMEMVCSTFCFAYKVKQDEQRTWIVNAINFQVKIQQQNMVFR